MVQQDRWFLLAGFLAVLWRGTAKLVVCTRRPPEKAADPGNGGRKGARLEHASRASQEEPHECVRHVCGWTSCRVRLRQRQEGPESRRELTGERTYFKLRNRVSGNRGHPDENASVKRRGVVSFRGVGTLAVVSRRPCGLWTCSRRPRARGSRRHGRGDSGPRSAR